MIPTAEEIRQSLTGAWLLFRRDPAGMGNFSLTIEGFWRSFFAALLAAPAYIVLVMGRSDVGGATSWPGEILAYLVGWAAFPVIAIFLTRLLQLSHKYVPLIIASNWAAVLQILFFVAVLLASRIFPQGLQSFLLLIATVIVLSYQWFVVRTALETTAMIALGLVVVDFLISTVIGAAIAGG